ncbi:response regulator [Mitsuokella sp. AF21-1AC]|nr:response regulator [Mitsuokella sp. AF21-1AC]
MYKVLLVEDEEIIRRGLMYIVDWSREGCVVVGEAGDGEEGITKISELAPDIVITDVRMPFMDGLSMLEKTRSVPYETIIISGYDEFDYAKRAISLDVTEYLLKPVDFSDLHQALERVKEKIHERRQYRKGNSTELKNNSFSFENILQDIPEPKNPCVKAMLQTIQKQYASKLSMQQFSQDLGVSSVYLHTKFKQEMHYTFHDFLNRYRIGQAVKQLCQKDLKVYEIAEQVGFSDYKYFISVFKKYMGCSPKKFLERM